MTGWHLSHTVAEKFPPKYNFRVTTKPGRYILGTNNSLDL